MVELTVDRRPIDTVFDLLGRKENDLTYSLGWAFANVPVFLDAVLKDVFGTDPGEVQSINLQRFAERTVCRVDVRPAKKPTFVRGGKGDANLYVRLNNSTRLLNTADAIEYVNSHWR